MMPRERFMADTLRSLVESHRARLKERLIDYRHPVMIIVVIVTAYFAYLSFQLKLETSFGDLLPQSHPFVQIHNKYAGTFGGANNIQLMVEVRDGDIFTVPTLARIYRITEEMDRVYGVNHNQIDSIGHRTTRYLRAQSGGFLKAEPVMLSVPKTPEDATQIKRIVHNTESIYGILVSLDDRAALVRANFIEARLDHRRTFGEINENVIAPFQEGWIGAMIKGRDPLKPEVVSIWGLPWQKSEGDGEGNDPMPAESAITLHGPPMIRGNRMYCAWWGGGISIIDCADLRNMQLVGHVQWSPPFPGSTHTCWPIGDRPYLVVTDEARAKQKYWDSQFMWIVDARHETNPVPISTFFPDREKYFNRPGRFGAHNILENITTEGPWANIVFLTYFNAGLRAVDVSDVLRPKEIGCYVPELPDGQDAIQSNDIGADDQGRIYLIDRAGAGMHILEYTG